MNKLLFFCFSLFLTVSVHAQKVYFVYLQSEAGVPFYVKMGEKVHSSSAEGYLILPNMKDSTYAFLIGLTGKNRETQFSITINKNDKGYVIKSMDNNLALFDLQTLSLLKPIVFNQTSSGTSVAKTDSFTKLLAKASGDTSLLYQVSFAQPEKVESNEKLASTEKKEEVKKEPEMISAVVVETTPSPALPEKRSEVNTIQEKQVDTAQFIVSNNKKTDEGTTSMNIEIAKVDSVRSKSVEPLQEEEFSKSLVERKSESSTSEGFGLVFLDNYKGDIDTIKIVIPNPKMPFKDTATVASNEGKTFLDISNQPQPEGVATTTNDSASTKVAVTDTRKALCVETSTDDDFFKLRRDMAAEKTDEAMIEQAKKYFKNLCFKTEQIKYLSSLFLNEPSKYEFFDAAFLHVSDQNRYEMLLVELKDPYYINRFKALIAK